MAKVRRPIVEAADKNVGRVERAFVNMADLAAHAVPLAEMAEAIKMGDLTGLLRLLDLENRLTMAARGSGIEADAISFIEALQGAFKAGAEAEMIELSHVAVMKASIGTTLSFDLLNPETVNWLQTYTFNLIREIATSSRLAIQDIVIEAFRQGGHPYEQARDIRRMIGLTRQQAQAVYNYRNMLEGSPSEMRQALGAALRDRRFDPSVLNAARTGTGLPQAKIDAMVDQYYSRMLNYRARNIARTETLRASGAGQRTLWNQAVREGILKPDQTRRKWITGGGTRTCDTCAAVPRMNPGGVRLDGVFQTDIGGVDGPPLHPSCRCDVVLTFLPRGAK